MTNQNKCPQCGATHINHINSNKYSCPFCNHVFYIEDQLEFVKQETDEFIQAQQIEREELKRSMAQKRKNRIIYLLISCVLFVPITCLFCYCFFYIYDKYSDKYINFNNEYDEISFLQQAPFEFNGKTCVFSDYARKATIDGTTFEIVNGKIKGSYIWLRCNSDSTIAFFEIGEDRYERPIMNSTYRIFDFVDEDALREYLCEKPFEFMGDVFMFTKEAYALNYNGYEVSNYIEYDMRANKSETRLLYIESRARILIHHVGGIDIFNLMMTEDGRDAYLLQDGTKKKYKRIN